MQPRTAHENGNHLYCVQAANKKVRLRTRLDLALALPGLLLTVHQGIRLDD
jgi:hypothetical protein